LGRKNNITIAKIKKTSAILLIIIAFKAALLAKKRVNQKFIKRYEHKPTPSQPINICKKLSAETKINIQNVESDKYAINLVKNGSFHK